MYSQTIHNIAPSNKEEIIKILLNEYLSLKKQIKQNIVFQFSLILAILSALYLRNSQSGLDSIPFAGFNLDPTLFYYAVSTILYYLWVRFGFIFDTGIRIRKKIVDYDYFKNDENLVLHDNFFLDSYMLIFIPNSVKTENVMNKNANFLSSAPFFIIFSLMMGMNHAIILDMIFTEIVSSYTGLGFLAIIFWGSTIFLTYSSFWNSQKTLMSSPSVNKYVLLLIFTFCVTSITFSQIL